MSRAQKKRGLGLLDILIILAVLVVIAGGIWWATGRGNNAQSGGSEVTFSVELKQVPADFTEGIQAGDKVYDSQKGGYMGEVVSAEITPFTILAYSQNDRTYHDTTVEGVYNAVITVKGNAEVTDRSVTMGGVSIAVGKELFLKSKSFAGSGFCIIENLGGGQG